MLFRWKKMKYLAFFLLCLVVAATVVAAIPENCLPCPDDYNIICKNPNRDRCRILQSISGGTAVIEDYTLSYVIECKRLKPTQERICFTGKMLNLTDIQVADD